MLYEAPTHSETKYWSEVEPASSFSRTFLKND